MTYTNKMKRIRGIFQKDDSIFNIRHAKNW